MIPIPQIVAELVMALGGALLFANVWVLVRPRVRPEAQSPARVPTRGRVIANIFIGGLVFVWALASFITRGAGK